MKESPTSVNSDLVADFLVFVQSLEVASRLLVESEDHDRQFAPRLTECMFDFDVDVRIAEAVTADRQHGLSTRWRAQSTARKTG
ncbi:MAG: hypothetical protein DDT34_02157 [Firmicutes bacterium]|nr:hypothetical protein [Bacillota bacterium]